MHVSNDARSVCKRAHAAPPLTAEAAKYAFAKRKGAPPLTAEAAKYAFARRKGGLDFRELTARPCIHWLHEKHQHLERSTGQEKELRVRAMRGAASLGDGGPPPPPSSKRTLPACIFTSSQSQMRRAHRHGAPHEATTAKIGKYIYSKKAKYTHNGVSPEMPSKAPLHSLTSAANALVRGAPEILSKAPLHALTCFPRLPMPWVVALLVGARLGPLFGETILSMAGV